MKPTKLDIYLRLSQHRLIGSTLFNVMGVNYDRKGIFIFADRASAANAFHNTLQYLRNQGVELPARFTRIAELQFGPIKFATIADLTEENYAYLMGIPISIDHFALERLIEDDRKKRFEEWTKSRH